MPILKPKNIQRIVRIMNAPLAGKLVPYEWGSRQILKFLKTDYARNVQFASRLSLLEEFLRNFEQAPDIEDLLPDFFVSSFLKPWRAMAFSYFNDHQLKKYVRLHGFEQFMENHKKGNGVILLSSHWGFAEAAITLFPLLGYKDFYTVVRKKGTDSMKLAGLNKHTHPRLIVFNDHSNAELFKSLFKARDVLKNGHIFHILGDGYHGKSSVDANFKGRIRGFRASFAELGLATEAVIHPIFIDIDNHGYLDVYILDPLDKGDESMDKASRIRHMVDQYVALLERRWTEKPQHINLGFMEKYLRQVHQNLQ